MDNSFEFFRYFVDATILMCYIGIGAVYVVFISGIIQKSFDSERILDQEYYALFLFPLCFVINIMKYLHDIAVISIFGNLLLFTAAMIGALYAVKDGIGEKWVMIGSDMYLYPKFVGTVLFSMSSPGIVSFHLYSVNNGESNVQFLD